VNEQRSPADFRREARERMAAGTGGRTFSPEGTGIPAIPISRWRPAALPGRDQYSSPDGGAPAPPGAVTSDHTGQLDFIRTAIMALQHFAEQTSDDVELAKVHKCIVRLQSILADHASTKDKALGMTPALQHVRRSTQGH
jgi:hypothetical protein